MTPPLQSIQARDDQPLRALSQRISATFNYTVHFTHDVFDPDNTLLASSIAAAGSGRRHDVLAYVDGGLVEANESITQRIATYCAHHSHSIHLVQEPRVIAGGEQAKNNWRRVQDIMAEIGDHRMCRHSFVLAIGGGAVLDMVGFAASIVHRGLRMIRIPTTVLSQNDGGVGVKTGMNEHGQKNFIGTFAPPYAVINDLDFLHSLPEREWRAGIAEAFKVAIIRDASFFDFLCRRAEPLRRREMGDMETLVHRCAEIHLEHIREGNDPFETASARPLDFGHWSAHKLELMSDYTIGHGQAVAIGIAIDIEYASRTGRLNPQDAERILDGLERSGLPTWHALLERRGLDGRYEILDGLDDFREHLGGVLTITLPDGIGARVDIHDVHEELVLECIRSLAQRASRADGTEPAAFIEFPPDG